MVYLWLENIIKSFGNLIVNDNISIFIVVGFIYVILGENGVGKIILMNILLGLY